MTSRVGPAKKSHGSGPSAFDRCAVAAGGEVGGGGEVGAVAGLGGGPAEPDGEMGFPDAGWPDEQDVGGGVEVAAGGQLVDELGVDAGGGVEVEVRQGGWGGQRCEPEPTGE